MGALGTIKDANGCPGTVDAVDDVMINLEVTVAKARAMLPFSFVLTLTDTQPDGVVKQVATKTGRIAGVLGFSGTKGNEVITQISGQIEGMTGKHTLKLTLSGSFFGVMNTMQDEASCEVIVK